LNGEVYITRSGRGGRVVHKYVKCFVREAKEKILLGRQRVDGRKTLKPFLKKEEGKN
jgi:hypothetical protein